MPRVITLTELPVSYDAVPAGAPLAIFGSSGELEISVNRGDAGRALGIGRGGKVRITRG